MAKDIRSEFVPNAGFTPKGRKLEPGQGIQVYADPPRWTREIPERPGWYWIAQQRTEYGVHKGWFKPEIAELSIRASDGSMCLTDGEEGYISLREYAACGWMWCGPLETPALPGEP